MWTCIVTVVDEGDVAKEKKSWKVITYYIAETTEHQSNQVSLLLMKVRETVHRRNLTDSFLTLSCNFHGANDITQSW